MLKEGFVKWSKRPDEGQGMSDLLKEYEKEKKLYDAIFSFMDELLKEGMAIDTYWGRDANGNPIDYPHHKDLQFFSLHGAATVASAEVLERFFGNPGPPGTKGCHPHRATIISERLYKEIRSVSQD